MIFYDDRHETSYNDICSRMKYLDCYHRSLAYLLALDVVLREHINTDYNLIRCENYLYSFSDLSSRVRKGMIYMNVVAGIAYISAICFLSS